MPHSGICEGLRRDSSIKQKQGSVKHSLVFVWWRHGDSNPFRICVKAFIIKVFGLSCMNLCMNERIEVFINLVCYADLLVGKGLLIDFFHDTVCGPSATFLSIFVGNVELQHD